MNTGDISGAPLAYSKKGRDIFDSPIHWEIAQGCVERGRDENYTFCYTRASGCLISIRGLKKISTCVNNQTTKGYERSVGYNEIVSDSTQ